MSGALHLGGARALAARAAAIGLVAAAFLLSGCGDSLVGSACQSGFRAAAGECVPVDAGLDGPGEGDAGDSGPDAHVDAGDGAVPDAEVPTGCPVGTADCGGTCVRLDVSFEHCGECNAPCDVGQVCAGGTCAASCQAPRAACPGGCVDTRDDASNCGACGTECPSGVCSASTCQLSAPGHLVVIGHDYATASGPMRRVIGNALFLAQGNPVNVLAYEGTVAAPQRTGVNAAIDAVGDIQGRAWAPENAQAEYVSYQLSNADVFLIYPQAGGTNASLRELGATWANALQQFLERGGVVVLADGPAAGHDGTWQILDEAGLFSAEGRTTANGDTLTSVLPVDAVMVGVPVSYVGLANTVWFETNEATPIVAHPDGPVVIHRVAVP